VVEERPNIHGVGWTGSRLLEGGLENGPDMAEPVSEPVRGLLQSVLQEDALSDSRSIEGEDVRKLGVE
jgi:hypothetical protein